MAKRVAPHVVHNVVRAAQPNRTTAPTYLVKRRDIFVFQIRWPKKLLVPYSGIPPLRVRLGTRSRQVAQERALWLGFPSGNSLEEFVQNLAASQENAVDDQGAAGGKSSEALIRPRHELGRGQRREGAAPFDQFIERPGFDDAAMVEHENDIRLANRSETVGDHEGRAPLARSL